MTDRTSRPEATNLQGRIGIVASTSDHTLNAVRQFAPSATPVISESRSELLTQLHAGALDYAFLDVGNRRQGTFLESYTALSENDVAIVGEYVDENTDTRFLLLGQGQWLTTGHRFTPNVQAAGLWLDFPVLAHGRTSLVFALPDKPGALVRALGAMSRRHVNVSNLEMRPPQESHACCTVVADIDGYAHEAPVKEALDELHRLAADVRVLGAYRAAV